MMVRPGGMDVPYARGDGWQASELRYLGPPNSPQLAMLLVLPDDLPAFEAGLTAAKLETITAAVTKELDTLRNLVDCPGAASEEGRACYRYNLTLFMPRFGIETRALLNEVLTALGMPLAFDAARADFSGINAQDPVHIGFVVHQANIDVDEKGTEAAAATAVGMDVGGGPSPLKEVTLRLDKPFLFFVRDVETGAVLFMGRVVDPSVPRSN
jgi:serpin B